MDDDSSDAVAAVAEKWMELIDAAEEEIKTVPIETIQQWLMVIPQNDRAGFNLDWKNDSIQEGRTMLQCAIKYQRLDIIQLLLEHGADITIGDEDGSTAFMNACFFGYDNGGLTVVKLLMDMGADIKFADKNGNTALIFAADQGHTKIAELLLDKGADTTSASKEGATALIQASMLGHTDIVQLLLDRGADITFINVYGNTAMLLAASNGHTDTVQVLLDRGDEADLVNFANESGYTALSWAAYNGHVDTVALLLDRGADAAIPNKYGDTALVLASRNGHTDTVELLKERSLPLDIGSLLDAGVTIKRLEELYPNEEVHKVAQTRVGEQAEEEANGAGRPSAAAVAALTVEDGDEENVQVPAIPTASKIESSSQSLDIGTLVDAGATMEKLEEVYPKEKVHKVVQGRIVMKQTKEEDEMQRRRRGTMARLLFLRSKSTALKEVLTNSAVMDQVLLSLLADPEDKILMCPLMLTPLKDPVVISSGFVMDRSTALDENGNLRIQLCPFSRKVLSLPVYPCIPIRSKLKAWEAERMNRCIGVAEKMVESNEWDRATRVFDIADTLLQEMGYKTYLNLATKLANLERKIPFVENDVERMVKIHQRLIRAAKGNKGETVKLLRHAIQDCCRKLGGSMLLSDDLQECTKTRSEFSKEVLSPMALIEHQAELRDEILELYGLDLALAKKSKSTTAIWCSRRMILGLWETTPSPGDDDENSNSMNKTKISEFLKQEGLTGNERELSLDNYDSLRYWPQDELADKRIGLARLGVETINSLECKVDLNPCNGSDHWVEIAFRPTKLGYPSEQYSIFSQHGPGTGWEIRAGKKTCNEESNFVEAVWTTIDANGELEHNAFFNRLVPVIPGQWYHVVLSFNKSTLELKLYVNGQPVSKTVEGTFQPDSRFPRIGQNLVCPDRQFEGMVAFASGDTQFPVDSAEADLYVQSLHHVRLQKLWKSSLAMVELDLTAGGNGQYYYDNEEEEDESEYESSDGSEETSE